MQTIKELNDAILKITMTIKDTFPELSKYIEEMPVAIPKSSNPAINNKILTAYYESLEGLLKKYSSSHNSTNP